MEKATDSNYTNDRVQRSPSFLSLSLPRSYLTFRTRSSHTRTTTAFKTTRTVIDCDSTPRRNTRTAVARTAYDATSLLHPRDDALAAAVTRNEGRVDGRETNGQPQSSSEDARRTTDKSELHRQSLRALPTSRLFFSLPRTLPSHFVRAPLFSLSLRAVRATARSSSQVPDYLQNLGIVVSTRSLASGSSLAVLPPRITRAKIA